MGYAELIQKRLQALPEDKQAEIYDFVEFIAARAAGSAPVADWTPAEFAEMSMQQALRGTEGESVTYTRADIEKRRQQIQALLLAARKVFPVQDAAQLQREFRDMRGEWDGRGWEEKR